MNRRTRPLKEGKKGPSGLLAHRGRLFHHLQGYLEHNKKLQISFPTNQRSTWFTQEFYCCLLKYYSGFEVQSRRSSSICLAWLSQAQLHSAQLSVPSYVDKSLRFKAGWVSAGFWGARQGHPRTAWSLIPVLGLAKAPDLERKVGKPRSTAIAARSDWLIPSVRSDTVYFKKHPRLQKLNTNRVCGQPTNLIITALPS